MRNAFSSEIAALAEKEERVVLLSGDIGNRLFDSFKLKFPDRFMNCGVAEANMMSMAAGMALAGLRPVVYTINSFVTTRCYEQIKIDICFHNCPVLIVGVGAGLGYASLGPTHHTCEDIAIMRALPNMTVVCPGDPLEVKGAVRSAMKEKGPVFIRLGKKGEAVVHLAPPPFHLGKGIVVKSGKDVCLVSTGNVLPLAMESAKKLDEAGRSAQVVSLHTVKPLDDKLLVDIFSTFPIVVAIEEHSVIGGLGGSLAEWCVAHPHLRGRLIPFGIPDSFMSISGDQQYARQIFGLTSENIVKKIMSL